MGRSTSKRSAVAAKKKHNLNFKNKSSKTVPVRSSSRRKADPKFLTCPDTNETIYITTATLPDIALAQKTKTCPLLNKKRRCLVTVASPAVRQQVYDQAALALQCLEQRMLPKYGGRPWQVSVRVTDPSSTTSSSTSASSTKRKSSPKSPYFVWSKKGQLELATWPHLLEKIPDPPRFPGYSQGGDNQNRNPKSSDADVTITAEAKKKKIGHETLSENDLAIEELIARQSTNISAVAYQDRARVPLPQISIKWMSPLREPFYTRKSAYERAVDLCKHEVLIDRVLHGYYANGKRVPVQATLPAKSMTLKAGKLRFERDGLWVVGQEVDWQVQRIQEHEKSFSLKDCDDSVQDDRAIPKSFSANNFPCGSNGRRLTALGYYLQSRRSEYRAQRLKELNGQQQQNENLVALYEADPPKLSLVEDIEAVTSHLSTQRPVGESLPQVSQFSDSSGHCDSSSINAECSDVIISAPTINNVLYGTGTPSSVCKNDRGKNEASFTLRDSERELRVIWKSMNEQLRNAWTKRYEQYMIDWRVHHNAEAGSDLLGVTSTENLNSTRTSSKSLKSLLSLEHNRQRQFSSLTTERSQLTSMAEARGVITPPSEEDDKLESACTLHIRSTSPLAGFIAGAITVQSNKEQVKSLEENMSTFQNSSTGSNQENLHSQVIECDEKANMKRPFTESYSCQEGEKARSKVNKKGFFTSNEIVSVSIERLLSSVPWRLTDAQVKLCYDAGVEHFEQIMRTVKARALYNELQDGFDLLRERGRGRYDMELPVFEEPRFSFITDIKKAPWMPVVREILGKDVVLIHKGIFMSLPGAERQMYHQDGLHLTSQYQKPCHAINVFVPLVDLTLECGPTEFCLGSHILGNENMDRDFLETPVVHAGVPIIFDYRLGHRGNGNTSSACRPILYCTYAKAADGKEFRDVVNFSEKRYHKIGELVNKGPSREERAFKRSQLLGENWTDSLEVSNISSNDHCIN